MLYSFFLITINVGCSSAFRPRYPTIYYRTKKYWLRIDSEASIFSALLLFTIPPGAVLSAAVTAVAAAGAAAVAAGAAPGHDHQHGYEQKYEYVQEIHIIIAPTL